MLIITKGRVCESTWINLGAIRKESRPVGERVEARETYFPLAPVLSAFCHNDAFRYCQAIVTVIAHRCSISLIFRASSRYVICYYHYSLEHYGNSARHEGREERPARRQCGESWCKAARNTERHALTSVLVLSTLMTTPLARSSCLALLRGERSVIYVGSAEIANESERNLNPAGLLISRLMITNLRSTT